MATYRKKGDKWYAELCSKGVRKSKSFSTKVQAIAWATVTDAMIRAGKNSTIPDKTFEQLLERYRDEVSVTKRGERWEKLRINLVCRDPIAATKLSALRAPHVAAWRDRRLTQVSPASVLREWNLLSAACSVARREWHWLDVNPFSDVKRPEKPRDRVRRITDDETTLVLYAAGYIPDQKPVTLTSRVGAAFLFAIETAMRAGEICNLTWEHVHATHVHLPQTKNGHTRDVPITPEARRILRQLKDIDETSCFALSSGQLDSLFRKIKSRCLIEDMHFHDTRREALTRMSRKLTVMELARVSGHRDLKILLNVYYTPDIRDLAAKLQ